MVRCIKICLCFLLLPAAVFASTPPEDAEVVLIVDTSKTMQQKGMDPQRVSLLVAKLFADMVPGRLAVIRLIKPSDYQDEIKTEKTGEVVPCDDDPSLECSVFRIPDAERDKLHQIIKQQKPGVLLRSMLGDAGFKQALDLHLRQDAVDSQFYYSFLAAQGVFAGTDKPNSTNHTKQRHIIWLSDGRATDGQTVQHVVNDLQRQGVHLHAVIFGKGDDSLAKKLSLSVHRINSPATAMAAFADIFRDLVQAPLRLDQIVDSDPTFDMLPLVEQAWVVVYGDSSLSDAQMKTPSSTLSTPAAWDAWPTAGAYQVFHVKRPEAGAWRVQITGGGRRAAYAVIQKLAVKPALVSKPSAIVHEPYTAIARLVNKRDASPINNANRLKDIRFHLEHHQGSTELRDDGVRPDKTAGDGLYSGIVQFAAAGSQSVDLVAQGKAVNERSGATIEVLGVLEYQDGNIQLDLGSIGLDEEHCQPVPFRRKQAGTVPLGLSAPKPLPDGHRITLQLRDEKYAPGDQLMLGERDHLQACLTTAERAPSIRLERHPTLELKDITTNITLFGITISVNIEGLDFWQLWGWLIITILISIALLIIVLGFATPRRFPAGLSMVYSPEYDDLSELTPTDIKQWPGIGVHFYQNATAYMQDNYTLSGKKAGALVELKALDRGNLQITPLGVSLSVETLEGDWEQIEGKNYRTRPGQHRFRMDEQERYFSIGVGGLNQ